MVAGFSLISAIVFAEHANLYKCGFNNNYDNHYYYY